jgi:aldose 1-epimerase
MVGEVNIVQGFPKQSLYKSYNDPYFGETIGRVANRIKDGKIDALNGKPYTLAVNNGPNHLHGGVVGWGKKIWNGPEPVGIKSIVGLQGGNLEGGETVKFTLRSEDGDEGYPGTVETSVIYTTGTQKTTEGKEVTVLGIEYEAELVGGAEETVINITNHS